MAIGNGLFLRGNAAASLLSPRGKVFNIRGTAEDLIQNKVSGSPTWSG